MTPRTFLVHGLLAGLVAGLAAFLVAYVVAEPQVDAAIALEEAGSAEPAEHSHAEGTAAHAHEHDHGEEAGHSHGEGAEVSRSTQSTWGLATGTLLLGSVLGGGTALGAAFALGRLGGLGARASTAVVALAGFVATSLVPFLKYPPTPPAVGDGETIGERTALYFGFWAISLVAGVAAVVLGRRLLEPFGGLGAVVAATAAYLVVVVGIGTALPTVNELGDFPADVLWYFRRESLLTVAALWAVLGVVLTALVGRDADRVVVAQQRREAAAAL
ncbi:CbtA family protein [Aeromicrobium massiliense]|uniref:CbtA family protein n=1 Tax=Aeromicrobium massiliense TaxID=1464554 RepID=UPI0005784886|nr:CbtA family protein [Aeromicrobium massiliense]